MRVVVPFSPTNPKTRFEDFFSPDERRALAHAMLSDVLAALSESGHEPEILSTAPLDIDVPTVVDERPLSAAVNAVLDPPTAVVMADLPLATPAVLSRLFSPTDDVVLAPGRGGGTNALVVRHPDFRVDYHGTSYLDHVERAHAIGASVETVDSFRLSTDIDERADLTEVLVHSGGRTHEWLSRAGVRLEQTDGRITVERATASE